MLCVITMFSVFLLMLGINVYSIILHDFKLQLIAYEAAKADTECQYWLGMKRSDPADPAYSRDHSQAVKVAETLASIQGVKIDGVEFSSPDDFKTSVCTIKSPLQLPFAEGVFAGYKILDRSTQGVATASTQAAPMMVQLNSKYFPNFTNPNSTVTRNASVFIPCYGACTQGGVYSGNTTFNQVTCISQGQTLPIGIGVPMPSKTLASDVRKSVGIMDVGCMNGSGTNGSGGFAPVAGDALPQIAIPTSSRPNPNGTFTQPNTTL